jgi:hypothetical protein
MLSYPKQLGWMIDTFRCPKTQEVVEIHITPEMDSSDHIFDPYCDCLPIKTRDYVNGVDRFLHLAFDGRPMQINEQGH